MKLKVKPIVIGMLGTVTKELVQGLEDLEIRGQVETIQTIALLRLPRILRKVEETCFAQTPVETHQLTLV